MSSWVITVRPNKGAYVLDALNVNWRRDAYYHGLLCGAREDLTALAVSWGGRIYRGLVDELPGILDVTINPTMYGSIVRIDKQYESHPQEVIEAVFKLSPAYNRMCIVVDRDIDIHDLGSVWWSFLTRGNLDTRTHVFSGLPGMEDSNYLISGYNRYRCHDGCGLETGALDDARGGRDRPETLFQLTGGDRINSVPSKVRK